MTDLLDRPLANVLAHAEDADRMLTAAAGASGRPYVELYERFLPHVLEGGTVREHLEDAGVDVARTAEGVRMLDRAASEMKAHHANSVRLHDADATEPPSPDELAAALADPLTRETRWQRAKQMGLAASRDEWEAVDRESLEVGTDRLRLLDHEHGARLVRESDEQLAKRLDAAIRAGHESGGLRTLEAAIGRMRRPDRDGQVISLAAAKPAGQQPLTAPAGGVMSLEEAQAGANRALAAFRGTDASWLGDPQAFERNLARARKATGAYDGPGGRQRFMEDARRAVEQGRDLVGELEARRDDWAANGIIPAGGRA